MRDISRKWISRYGIALVAVMLAVLLRLVLDPLLNERLPLATLFAAVVFVAWYGGRGPASLALILGSGAVAFFIMEPRYSFHIEHREDTFSLLFYAVISAGSIVLFEQLRIARRQAEGNTAQVRQEYQQLQQESELRQKAETTAAEEGERFRVTLTSIGDGVITTDAEGRVSFMNDVARQLTGWTLQDAKDVPLKEVFHIINETTRLPVANPVEKVLREGVIVGLANHTILVAKDGTEWPIDDSAAPIRDESGKMLGVVLIFRDITEQRRAQKELQESEALKRAILETALDCIITMDHHGKVIEFNPAAERTFGYSRAEAIGQELASLIIPPSLRERHARGLAHYLATGEAPVIGKRIEISAMHADGGEFMVELAITRLPSAGPPLFTAFLRGISERMKAPQHRAARLAVTQVLNQSLEIQQGAQGVLQAVCENLAWEVGSFWTFNEANDHLVCFQSWHQPDLSVHKFEETSKRLEFANGEGLPGRVWATGKPAWIRDIREDANFPRLPVAADYGLHSGFACPVVVNGKIIGVFEFFSRLIREPDADLLEMMSTVAGNFGQFNERQIAEKELRQSEAELADFFDHATIGLHWVGPDGAILRANDAELQMLGYSREEYVGHSIADFHADEHVINDILHCLKSGAQIHEYPARLLCKDGSIKDVLIDSSVMFRNGVFVHSRCFTRDITERKRAEIASRQSEQKLQLLADTIPQLAWMARPDGHIFWYNRRWYEYTGTTFEQMEGWGWQAVHDHDTLPGVMDRWRASIASGEQFEMVFPLKGADGHFRSFLTRVNPLRDEQGQVIYWFGTNTDIEDQQRGQKALAQSEERFRQLADAMPQIVWTALPDGNIDYQNRRWLEFTGLPESLGNKGWEQIMHPGDAALARVRWSASLQSGAPFEMEIRLLDRRTQGYRWHLIRSVAVKDEEGNVARWFGTSTDIDEQMRAEESSRYLAEASAALAGVVDYESTLQKVANLAVPYFSDWSAVDMADDKGALRRLAVAHHDAGKLALVNQLLCEYPPDPEAPEGALAVIRSGKPQIVSGITDEMLVHAARDERHLALIRSLGLKSYICVPLVVSGTALGAFTFATAESGRIYTDADLVLAMDLASRASVAIENTQLYQALRESDRRKDEFLATLAHELRNPLAPIRNSLQILKMPQVDAVTIERSREMMERQVHHLVRLVDDLLDVSRVMGGKIELRRERVELASIVARAVEMVQPLLDIQSHELSVRLPSHTLAVDADPIRLSQVVGNILANAAKYSEPNGRILLLAEREGDMVALRIQDNGIGIVPAMLSRIFQLFVQVDHASTKAQGGLGIGLTLAKNLVEMHNGTIEAHSGGLGKGSEFVVRLPISRGALLDTRVAATEGAPHPLLPSGLRLLVVDDNQDAALSLEMLLKLEGHEVRVAHSGMAALEMVPAYVPDVVFLDIGMPCMDGYEVARRLRQHPGLENVVLAAVTGWGQEEDRRRTNAAGFNYHLVKPPELAILQNVLAGAVETIRTRANDSL